MSKPKRINPRLGIPRGIPAELRLALAEELERMGTTYPDFISAADGPVDPETVLKLAKLWNSLTPEQVAAWDDAARQENIRRGLDPSVN